MPMLEYQINHDFWQIQVTCVGLLFDIWTKIVVWKHIWVMLGCLNLFHRSRLTSGIS